MHLARPPYFLQVLVNLRDPVSNAPAVGLDLRFTRSTRADSATEARKHATQAGHTREHVLKLREFDLQSSLTRMRALREDVQDHCRPIEYLDLEFLFERSFLRRAEVIVDDEDVVVEAGPKFQQFFYLALAREVRRRKGVDPLNLRADNFRPGGGDKVRELRK
jgi:hypothetical protein